MTMIISKLDVCPRCGVKLEAGSIGYEVAGTMLYNIGFDGKDITYDQDEFDSGSSGAFFCRECSAHLDLTEQNIVKLFTKGG